MTKTLPTVFLQELFWRYTIHCLSSEILLREYHSLSFFRNPFEEIVPNAFLLQTVLKQHHPLSIFRNSIEATSPTVFLQELSWSNATHCLSSRTLLKDYYPFSSFRSALEGILSTFLLQEALLKILLMSRAVGRRGSNSSQQSPESLRKKKKLPLARMSDITEKPSEVSEEGAGGGPRINVSRNRQKDLNSLLKLTQLRILRSGRRPGSFLCVLGVGGRGVPKSRLRKTCCLQPSSIPFSWPLLLMLANDAKKVCKLPPTVGLSNMCFSLPFLFGVLRCGGKGELFDVCCVSWSAVLPVPGSLGPLWVSVVPLLRWTVEEEASSVVKSTITFPKVKEN